MNNVAFDYHKVWSSETKGEYELGLGVLVAYNGLLISRGNGPTGRPVTNDA